MANTPYASYPSDSDETAYRLISSVKISNIVDEGTIDNMAHGVADALQSMVKDSAALQDYPDIPSETDDSYRYIGG